MFAKPTASIDGWTAPATAAFEYWVSLWPTAPIFGVAWRFADTGAKRNLKPAESVTSAQPAEYATEVEAAAAPLVRITLDVEPVFKAAAKPARANRSSEPTVPASLMVQAPQDPDDLTAIKGIGPSLARQLNGLGVYKLSQIAEFSDEDLAWIDLNLSSFRGRCFRENWIGQAKALLG